MAIPVQRSRTVTVRTRIDENVVEQSSFTAPRRILDLDVRAKHSQIVAHSTLSTVAE